MPAAVSKLEENIPSLRRYARSLLRNVADADDLVQDCLVRALDRMDTLRTEGDLRPWLFTIMHNVFVNRWRRMTLSARFLSNRGDADVAVAPSQEDKLQFQDVLRALDTLPEEQREVLLLVAVEGFQYDEVARILDVPIGTVMSRLSRGRDKMGHFMQGRERPMLRRVK
jgi:RNA polymerase sigma-70 factor (ECF subfamily)